MAMEDLLIVGAGVAGLTAAIYARRANLSAVVFDGNLYGGQIAITPEIANYPGIAKITGADFAMQIYDQAVALGAEVRFEAVESVTLEGPVKKITTSAGEVQGRALIIANGVQRRKIGCPGEEPFSGRGVSYCATCDGALYKGKEVCVVGGGNTALEDALYLAGGCSKVHVIHRRDEFRGDPSLADAVLRTPNIQVHWNSVVSEIQGEKSVGKVVLTENGEPLEVPVSGVFVCIGLQPENGLFSSVPLDETGYFAAGEDCKTPLPGVFVAGDCRSKPLRQIVTAAADGAVAAFQAGNYIRSMS